MSRGGIKINTGDYEYVRSERGPDWLSDFAEKLAAREEREEQKTAVEVMRERSEQASLFDRIDSIMNGKTSRYSSVEEAVQDYQKRTGLADFQKQALANEIIAGSITAEGEEEDSAEKKTEKPAILEEHPAIETYIHNVIDTQYGIQLPAVLHGILEMFGRDGVRETDLDSEDLIRYVSDLIRSNQRSEPIRNDTSIGRGVGRDKEVFDINDPNRDPFIGLMPKRMI